MSADPPPLPLCGWMIVQLKPNGAALARRNLARQGFAVLMPDLQRTRSRRGRLVTLREPVFPGYLFIRAEGAEAAAADHTQGVARLLMADARSPALLPEEFVAALLARCDAEGVLDPAGDLAAGMAVRITAGPFSDHLTRIDQIDRDGRLHVLMQVLGGPVRMSLAPGQVAPAETGKGR